MSALLKKHPYISAMASYALLWSGSDIVQQKYVSKHSKVNYTKTIKTAMIGALYVAPFITLWQRYIHKALPGYHWKTVLKKIVREHIQFGPFMMTGFFSISHIVQDNNYNPREIVDEVVEKVPKTWLLAVPMWSSVAAINQFYIPLHYRMHFTGVVTFFWGIYLCYVKVKPYHHHHLENGHLVEDDVVIPPKE